jgi:putative oxidoreductase
MIVQSWGNLGEDRAMTMTNGILLSGRMLLATWFLPQAFARLSNISGFAVSLSAKGVPYGEVVAAAVTLAGIVGPLALIVGIAPRLSASALIAATVITTGTLHRFWELAGAAARQAEQTLFLAQFGIIAALLLYLVTGPGAWSWQAWWRADPKKPKPAARNRKPSRPRAARPRPAPSRPSPSHEDLADAA